MTTRTNPYPTERCNIGPAEIERRRRLAIVLTAVSLVVSLLFVILPI